MGFCLFMFIVDLLIPGTMIGIGVWFKHGAVKKINYLMGYRTPMSMKNMDTWRFAHDYSGKLLLRWGLIILPLSVIPLLLIWGSGKDTVAAIGGTVCFVQCIPLFGCIVATEQALRKNFDRDGRRKSDV